MVLHFYQPPMQDLTVTKQVLETSYLPVLRLLSAHPRARVTLNISACLLQQMHKLKRVEFFEAVNTLISQHKIELLGGPAYHPILPLVTARTLDRQFKKSEYVFGDLLETKAGKGIFIPELAATESLMNRLKEYGDYTLIDQTAVEGDYYPVTEVSGLRAYVNNRNVCDVLRSYSRNLSGKKLAKWVAEKMTDSGGLVTLNDVEAFGHHYQERTKALEQIFDSPDFEFVTLKDLTDVAAVNLRFSDSSWQYLPEDKRLQGAFWLWKNPQNHLQMKYWDLVEMAEKIYEETKQATEGYVRDTAAEHLDRGLSSCYLYWLSNWPWWHPDLVERGAQQLIKCCRTAGATKSEKLMAEEKYHSFLGELWKFHWSGQVEENYRQFDLEREKLLANLPDLESE